MRTAFQAMLGAATLLALALSITPADAASRVFVAGQGSDSNPCTFALPCRTFQKAHDTVAADGEIKALDPNSYGTLIITKSISIQGHGFAGIPAASPNAVAITINAGATDKINIRGVLLEGGSSSNNNNLGIRFNSGGSLTVEDGAIRNFFSGVYFGPGTSAKFGIRNTTFSDNYAGVYVFPTGTSVVHGVLDRVMIRASNETFGNLGVDAFGGGQLAGGEVNMTAIDCSFSGMTYGVSARSPGAGLGVARVFLQRSAVVSNDTGISSSGSLAAVIVDRSSIFRNASGWQTDNGGQIFSYGNNAVHYNVANEGAMPVFTPR